MLSPAKILTVAEIQRLVDYYRKQAEELDMGLLKLTIVRLSACCGLRRKEMVGIDLFDLKHNGEWPYLVIRKEVTKGEKGKRKARQVPLWWDRETYIDLTRWQDYRYATTKQQNGPFLSAVRGDRVGNRMGLSTVAQHWHRIIAKVLGEDRARAVSIHKGRHSFASICAAAGISLPEIRDALGHSSLAITDIYTHVASDSGVRNLFGGKE